MSSRKPSILSKITKRSLIGQMGIYGFATLINAGLPFLLLPIISYYLTPAEYGLAAMFLLLQSIFTPLVSINIASAISRRYYYDESEEIFAEYVGNCFLLMFITLSCLIVIILFIHIPIIKITQVPLEWVFGALISAACYAIVLSLLSIWQVQSKPKKFALMQILMVATKLSLAILFVVVLLWGWQGRVLSILLAHVAFAIISFVILQKKGLIIFKVNKSQILHAAKFGFPSLPHSLAGFAIAYTDRLTINSLIGLDSMGLYTVAYQVSSVFNMAANAFNTAFTPWLYEQLKEGRDILLKKKSVVKTTYLSLLVFFLFYLVLVFLLPLVFNLLSVDYEGSLIFLNFLLLGFLFNAFYYLFCNYLFFAERTGLLSMITMSSAIINIPLTYFFVKIFGAIGAAQATAIVNFIVFIATWYVSNRTIPMPWFNLNIYKKV